MDEILEELYELLDLYFSIEIGSGFIKAGETLGPIEPTLDLIISREGILEKIIQKSQELPSV